jgi:DNA polymerase III delta subunit
LRAKEFQKEIMGPGRKHFYLIRGAEPLEVAGCVGAAREALAAAAPEMTLQSFSLDEAEADAVLDAAGTSALFSTFRIILARAPAGRKVAEGGLAPFVDWIKGPPRPSVIVLLHPKAAAGTRLVKAAAAAGMLVDCPAPEQHQLPGWVAGLFRARGLTLTQEGHRVLMERAAGESLEFFVSEAEKLSIWPGPGVPLTPNHIRELIPLSPASLIYEVSEPLGEGNLAAAYPVLLDILAQSSPFGLVTVLARHFLRLAALKTLLDEAALAGPPAADAAAAAKLSVKPGYIPRLKSQLAGWTQAGLTQALAAIEEARRKFVTSSLSPETVTEELAAKIASLRGRRGGL